MDPHTASGTRSFGVEEEYLLLNSWTGTPVNTAAELLGAIPLLRDRAEREFFSSQIETATPVCHTADQALSSLTEFRREIRAAAEEMEVTIAGTGLPPLGGDTAGTVTPRARYLAIDEALRNAASNQYSTGTHVHVEVPSRAVGVAVMTRLARWAPALAAMTANSPLWNGEPTGFASWRYILGMVWPTSGYPPPFADEHEYETVVAQLVDSGVLLDRGMLTWACRLSERFPTVELRIADAQLTAQDSVAFAALVRSAVDHYVREIEKGTATAIQHPTVTKAAIWAASRDGLETNLVDPLTGENVPAFDFIDQMVSTFANSLERHGDTDRVEVYLQRLRATGGPAQIQLRSFMDEGVPGLLDLYAR